MHNDAGKYMTVTVHKLVWITFVGPVPDGMQIDHWDTNKKNNCLSNLQLVTQPENMRRAALNGLCARGERNVKNKLTEQQVFDIRRRKLAGESAKSLAFEFGIVAKTVHSICRGKLWKHLNDQRTISI
jgi:hypothetical protein